ncbi:MACRO domain-containing protein [Xylariaceae sp. FL0594]|nr:MACRO domain-containing protein [Xylariaceae sp. FL0594]
MTPIPATDIPSLSLLYKLGKLETSPLGTMEDASPAHNGRVGLFRGDITTLQVDAIMNAANSRLRGGGGVDGAIHRAAGPELLRECIALDGCETGSCKITGAYNLPCKKVIHAVGPVYFNQGPVEAEALLRGCYTSALQLAVDNDLKTVAFSAISTGVYGYPSIDAAVTACSAVKSFLDREDEDGKKLEKVIFVTFEEKDVRAYNTIIPRYFPPASNSADGEEDVTDEQVAEAEAKASQLPSVPQTEPSDSEHTLKKLKKHRQDE